MGNRTTQEDLDKALKSLGLDVSVEDLRKIKGLIKSQYSIHGQLANHATRIDRIETYLAGSGYLKYYPDGRIACDNEDLKKDLLRLLPESLRMSVVMVKPKYIEQGILDKEE